MPDPTVILDELQEERDFLFDIRTGYAVLDKEPGHFDAHPYGEGNPDIFVIVRAKRSDVPAQWGDWSDEGRNRIRKLDLSQAGRDFAPANRIKSGLLPNVYKVKPAFTTGDDDDFRAEVAKYDTRQNAVNTVGTGYTFATIQASINAGASGDVSAVYGNGATPLVSGDYNENVVDGGLDGVQLIGMLESNDGILPAIRIWAAAGDVVQVGGNEGWHIENFEIDGVGTAQDGLQFGSINGSVTRCVMHDVTSTCFNSANDIQMCWNCVSYNGDVGFYGGSTGWTMFRHCTAVDNTTAGFTGAGVNDTWVRACLASNNGTDYINAFAVGCAWNVSSDLTAPGAGSRTGFNNANFVNYAGDDFRLAAAGENGANIDGWPLSREDYLANLRERDTLIFYAGAHDPFVPATGATVTSLGIVDAAPAAQGSIHIRFYEMCISGVADPYRYDVHVKRFDNGPLTAAEINANTYYARSFFAEEMNGCGGMGSGAGSGGLPGILQALINFEAPGDITLSVVPDDENMHLFTNRQYWIAVRGVAIDDTDRIYLDDNVEVALSYSPGHQGELWTNIINCVTVEPCAGAPTANVNVVGIPNVNIAAIPDLVISEIPEIDVVFPPIDAILRAGDDAGVLGTQGG